MGLILAPILALIAEAVRKPNGMVQPGHEQLVPRASSRAMREREASGAQGRTETTMVVRAD